MISSAMDTSSPGFEQRRRASARSRSSTPNPTVMTPAPLPRGKAAFTLMPKVGMPTYSDMGCGEDDITPRDHAGSLKHFPAMIFEEVTPRDHMSIIESCAVMNCKEVPPTSCGKGDELVQDLAQDELPGVPYVSDEEITMDIGREIGSGRYARVFSAKNRKNGRAEVVKSILKKDIASQEDWFNLRNEHASLCKVGQHPNIAWLTGALQSQERICFFLVFVKGKELFDFLKLRQQNKSPVPKVAIAQIFSGISQALACCHQHGICHRDVKPENIVVQQDYTAKLVDFGCACPRFELGSSQCVGSMPFIAPEFLSGTASDGAPADVWSLGVVLLEMLHGLRALSISLRWDSQKTSTQDCASDLSTWFSNPAQGLAHVRSSLQVQAQFEGDELLASMLNVDPVARPLAETLCESHWLKEFASSK